MKLCDWWRDCLRPKIEEIAATYKANVKVAEVPPGPPVLQTLVAEVYGPEHEEQIKLAEKIKRIFENTHGVVDTDWYVEDPQPKLRFVIDREKSAYNGITADQVLQPLRIALDGTVSGIAHMLSEKRTCRFFFSFRARSARGRTRSSGTQRKERRGHNLNAPGKREEIVDQEMTARAQTAKIFEWRLGFDAIFLINVGIRLGLFRAFAQTPGATPQEIAAALGLHEPYVEVWCTTAYALELLERDGNSKFRLAPSWEPILADAADPHYLGGLVQILAEFTSADFRRCPEAFRSGETVPFQGRGNIFAHLVAETTAGLHAVIIRKILPLLPALFDRLNSGGTILDVGCGNGNLLIRLIAAFPQSKCLGVDIDQTGLTLARAAIQEARVSDRVEILEGGLGTIVQANFVDLALMVEVLHEIAPARRPGVIQECARVLRPGGWLVILDETYPSTIEETRLPEFRLALQTSFEELIWGNLIPTRREQELLLREAGFTGEIHRSFIGEGLTLLTAQRNEIV